MSWSAFRTFTDPDAYQAAFRDMRMASVITGRGDFRADFVTIQLERLSLQDAKETLPRTAYCAVDPRLFGIGFATHPRQEIHVNSLELVPGAIVVFREASEGHNRFGSASRWGSVALPHEDIAAAGRTLIGHELVTPPHTHLIKPSPPVLSKLLSLHKAVGRLAEAAPEVLAGAEVARALEQTLIRVMIQCLSEGQGIEVGSSYWRHVAVMRRLKQARTALRDADRATVSVGEIARAWGFTELGRFARAYQTVFGETPLTTLRRPPGSGPTSPIFPILHSPPKNRRSRLP